MKSGSPSDWSPRLWWSVPAASVLLLLVLAMTVGTGPQEVGRQTSYDASSHGFRAAYLLLEELGFPVVRSKRLVGAPVRWVLFPTASTEEAKTLDGWVREGGRLLLADDMEAFALQLGMNLEIDDETDGPEDWATMGKVSVEWPEQAGRLWDEDQVTPLVTIYTRGRGEIWLVNRPEFLTNRYLRQANNAVLLCRLAEDMLQGQPGPLAFDEYCHGMRERPGVTELLLQPPLVWVTLQGMLLLALLLWHYVPRFGTLRLPASMQRRSREEFLDAMAALLERKGNHADAFAIVREALLRDIEHELALPVGASPEVIAQEAAQRRGLGYDTLLRWLRTEAPTGRAGRTGLVQAMNDLETARDEILNGRHHR